MFRLVLYANKTRLLRPLPIPESPFQSILMDFIVGFSKVNGLRSIMVVVDMFSKYALFIALLYACLTNVAAEIIHKHFVKYFGVLEDIISDCDVWFIGRFQTILFKLLASKMNVNHLQTNRKMERVNALLKNYLKHFVTASQKKRST